MQVVGSLYTKLVAFVNANAPAPEITSEDVAEDTDAEEGIEAQNNEEE
jgi:hypothetical protein